MNGRSSGSWSLVLGRFRGVELRLHIHLPLLALAVLLLAQKSDRLSISHALLGLLALVVSVLLHELVRMAVAHRVGGRTQIIVLGPTGGWAQPSLPADPPAHLVTALAGPIVYLSLLVSAACCLALYGETTVLRLMSPLDPHFITADSVAANSVTANSGAAVGADSLAGLTGFGLLLHQFAQALVWVNSCLLLVNLLPIHPCDGAELLRSVLWPLVGRPTASAAVAHVAFGAALMTGLLALFMVRSSVGTSAFIPPWFSLAVLTVLLAYGGNRASRNLQYDVGLDIDELESDDDQWISADWIDEDPAGVLVEQLQERQQEALNRKRQEREDREDARVDDILALLQHKRFDDLSEEDQAILKRASRRYRQRLESSGEE